MSICTLRTRKLWNGKTTLKQFLSVFDVVTKQIVLLDVSNNFLSVMGLFTLHNSCASRSLDYLKS